MMGEVWRVIGFQRIVDKYIFVHVYNVMVLEGDGSQTDAALVSLDLLM